MSTAVAAPCDDGVAASVAPAPRPHAALTLATSILASSLAFVDGSAVNVALPGDGARPRRPARRAALDRQRLPAAARRAAPARRGRGRPLRATAAAVGGIAAFAAASLACAAAPGFGCCSPAARSRALRRGMLMPNSLAVLGAAFAGEARGRAIGTWAAVGAVAGAVGPLLGRLAGRRGRLAGDLPRQPAARRRRARPGRRFVGESRDPDARALDWPGAAAATACLGALTWGLTRLGGERRPGTRQAWRRVATGLVLAALRRRRAAARRARDDAAGAVRHPELRRPDAPHLPPLRRPGRA